MRHRVWTALLCLLLPNAWAAAEDSETADQLFRSHDVLDVTITAPFGTLMKERPLETELPGTVSYVDEDGTTVSLDIEIRTRGRYRHQKRTCPFAPIRLNFDKSETKGTLFHKQDKLKLVTHCRNGSTRYQQAMFREYLAYRFFNEVTPLSFRVRLLRINYVDTENPKKEKVEHGFVIEHRDRLAKRIDLDYLELKRTNVGALNGAYTNLSSVFQYLIANTDFSPIAGAPDDFCCHNGTLFGKEGTMIHAIPYDFDMSGLVHAPYATPNPKFSITSVRQRLYRGRCINNEHLQATLQVFREKRGDFVALVESMPELNKASRRNMLAFMKKFDDVIDDPGRVQKKLVDKCV